VIHVGLDPRIPAVHFQVKKEVQIQDDAFINAKLQRKMDANSFYGMMLPKEESLNFKD
jgi:hypothetical protein